MDCILGGKSNALALVRGVRKQGDGSPVLLVSEGSKIAQAAVPDHFIVGPIVFSEIRDWLLSFGEEICLYSSSDYWLEFEVWLAGQDTKGCIRSSVCSGFDYELFLDKQKFYDSFSTSFDIPHTYIGKPKEGYILKNRRSFLNGSAQPKGFKLDGDLDNSVSQLLVKGSIKKHISFCGIAESGKVDSFIITRKILEYPSPGGTAVAVQSVEDTDPIFASVAGLGGRFISESRYTGAFELEMIVTDDRIWVIEFNARFWLQHELGSVSGVNFPGRFKKLLCGNLSPPFSACIHSNNLWLHEGVFLLLTKRPWLIKEIIKLIYQADNIIWAHMKRENPEPLLRWFREMI